jgi:GMP synthase (glutamine-hydrolysing)
MMCRWTTRGHERMLLPNAKPRVAHFADRPVYDPAGRAWLTAFLNHWLGKAGKEQDSGRHSGEPGIQ